MAARLLLRRRERFESQEEIAVRDGELRIQLTAAHEGQALRGVELCDVRRAFHQFAENEMAQRRLPVHFVSMNRPGKTGDQLGIIQGFKRR